jgi:hypothetical protein
MANAYATPDDLALYLDGVSESTYTAIWTALLESASRFIDTETMQFFYQIPSATYHFSGQGNSMIIPGVPIVSISNITVAFYTGGNTYVVPSGQYFLYPETPLPGHPYLWLELTNVPQSGLAAEFFYGKQNVAITMVAGWPSVPADIKHLTCKLAARAWKSRQTGYSGIQGNSETGLVYAKELDSMDHAILQRYQRLTLGGLL